MALLDAASLVPELDTVIRLAFATMGGLVLGLDRELRGKAAGLRTHALVSLSAAVTTISALLLYRTLLTGEPDSNPDPLRVIQGLAQAIGFIATGMIIVNKGDVRNLTSAANLWLAAAIGIAAGAAQYGLVLAALFFGIVILTLVRFLEQRLPGSEKKRDE